MLFKGRILSGLADGRVTLAFRRWREPRVRENSRMRTAAGVVGVTGIRKIAVSDISEADASSAGYSSREDLLTELKAQGAGSIFRIRLQWLGPDPRERLREQGTLTSDELEAVETRLQRLDAASSTGAWTRMALRLIRDRSGVRAADLAPAMKQDTIRFKRNVRKLKELGLTESLEVGYRLSPRGHAVLSHLFGGC